MRMRQSQLVTFAQKFIRAFCPTFSLIAVLAAMAHAQDAPEGFTAIFNGKDLAGWAAMETDDPRKFAGLSVGERAAAFESAAESTGKFWRVENGEIVNDGRGPYLTTTITTYLEDRPHPGKERTSGHFGLAGHRDPVVFRKLSIKTLDKSNEYEEWGHSNLSLMVGGTGQVRRISERSLGLAENRFKTA